MSRARFLRHAFRPAPDGRRSGAAVIALIAGALVTGACRQRPEAGGAPAIEEKAEAGRMRPVDPRAERMVARQIESRGVRDPGVLSALRRVPRDRFVPRLLREEAFADTALPIGKGQTISQPYIVAFMTEALGIGPDSRVLEIGTGSGYQAAVLAEIAAQVYTIEIVPELAESAADVLGALGYDNVHVRTGDGYRGWPEEAPFDAVIVTAAPDHVPQPLVEQLAVGARMIVPVGEELQELLLIEKTAEGVTQRSVLPVRFVPMTGEARRPGER